MQFKRSSKMITVYHGLSTLLTMKGRSLILPSSNIWDVPAKFLFLLFFTNGFLNGRSNLTSFSSFVFLRLFIRGKSRVKEKSIYNIYQVFLYTKQPIVLCSCFFYGRKVRSGRMFIPHYLFTGLIKILIFDDDINTK